MEAFVVWTIVGGVGIWMVLKFRRSIRSVASGNNGSGCPNCSSKCCCGGNHISGHTCDPE